MTVVCHVDSKLNSHHGSEGRQSSAAWWWCWLVNNFLLIMGVLCFHSLYFVVVLFVSCVLCGSVCVVSMRTLLYLLER